MPSSMSFLQAASAKISIMPAPSSSLQLLLVEDENKTLSYSLAMDAAYSLASSSSSSSSSPLSMQCKGCGFSVHNCCRCCRVAMLVATNQNQGQQQNDRKSNKTETDMPFPLWCYQEGMNDNNDKRERDQSALNQIQIRYVNSIEDVIKYLAYAPSLPQHLIPLDGIFLLGLGDLISRESAGVMELTNILSILSDTGFVLDKLRSEMDSSNCTQSTTLVATLNQQIYSSLPQTVYKQLGFSVASSVQNIASNSNTTTCELVFEDSPPRNSFTFTNNNDEEIVWSVE